MWGRRGMMAKIGSGMQKKAEKAQVEMAGNIDKADFLKQLRDAWYPYIKKLSSVEGEVQAARLRIDRGGLKAAFDKVGITDGDLRGIIVSIQSSLPEQATLTKRVGRNELCPCGSNKKYKKCCGV